MSQKTKYLRYGIALVVVVLLGYKSLYFEKLSTHNKKREVVSFDAAAYSKKLWEEQLPAKLDNAPALTELITAVAAKGDSAIERYSNALAIGNYRYALVKTQGTVEEIGEDVLNVKLITGDSALAVTVATEFIYGNAIRDASALVQVKDFPNTADLNGISESMNAIVRNEIIPGFKGKLKKGDRIQLVAATELNKAHLRWQGLELVPLRLTILP